MDKLIAQHVRWSNNVEKPETQQLRQRDAHRAVASFETFFPVFVAWLSVHILPETAKRRIVVEQNRISCGNRSQTAL